MSYRFSNVGGTYVKESIPNAVVTNAVIKYFREDGLLTHAPYPQDITGDIFVAVPFYRMEGRINSCLSILMVSASPSLHFVVRDQHIFIDSLYGRGFRTFELSDPDSLRIAADFVRKECQLICDIHRYSCQEYLRVSHDFDERVRNGDRFSRRWTFDE